MPLFKTNALRIAIGTSSTESFSFRDSLKRTFMLIKLGVLLKGSPDEPIRMNAFEFKRDLLDELKVYLIQVNSGVRL